MSQLPRTLARLARLPRLAPLSTLAGLAGLALVACGPNPPSGVWVFVQGEITANSCNNNDIEPSSGNFQLINNDNGTFTIDPQDGTDPFLCTLDGADFSCPQRVQQTLEALGATATIHATAQGVFDSDTFATGSQELTLSCEGDGCGLYAGAAGIRFPCNIIGTFTASFSGS